MTTVAPPEGPSSTPAMAALMIRLKLRLLRNTLRTGAGPGLVVFTILAVGCGVVLALVFRRSDELERLILAPLLGAGFVTSWMFGPVMFGTADETIDTTRIASLPVDPARLAGGLAFQSLIGPGPLAALVALAGAASTAPDVVSMVIAAVAVIATVMLATTLSRLVLTGLGNGLRRRRTRDLTTVATGVVIALLALVGQVAAASDRFPTLGELAPITDIVRLTPIGWPADALGRASTGAIAVPVVELIASFALITVIVRAWSVLLQRALVTPAEHDADQVIGDWFLDPSPATVGPLRLAVVKELRYFARHPRYRVQVASQATILVIGGAPFLGAVLDREPTAVLFGCVPALTAGVTGANLLGPDGRALWAEYLATHSLAPILRGRSLTFATLGVVGASLVTFAAAVWTGGWIYVPAALGAAVGMGLTGSGVGSITSVLAPIGFPDDDAPNPFATSTPGSGCLPAVITFSGVIGGLVLASPILAILGVARDEDAWILGTALLAPIYGAALWAITTRIAARRLRHRAPEIVTLLGQPA